MLHAGAAAHFPRAEYWVFSINPLFSGVLAFSMVDLLVAQQEQKKKKKKKATHPVRKQAEGEKKIFLYKPISGQVSFSCKWEKRKDSKFFEIGLLLFFFSQTFQLVQNSE